MENPVPETAQEGGSRLNTWVALSVAILSTVMGVSKVKDDNIVQAMQQAQADKNDHWAFYQARNLREEVAHAQVVQLQLQIADKPPAQRAPFEAALAEYQKIEADQAKKKEELRQQAAQDQKNYDALNFRDDQFDLADAGIAIAIAALAVASVTQTWWLFWLALVPGVFGTLMGIAGLAGWRLHPDWLTNLLS